MSYAEAQYTIDEVLAGMKENMVAGNEPNNLKNINIIGGDGHCFISFEAQDTVIDGQVVTTTTGVICRRKLGGYPDDENDGDLVKDFTGAELGIYSSTPYIDEGLENDTTYYYRFFPYTAYGMMNRSLNNTMTATPHDATIWGFHQDFTNLDPDTCITYIEGAKGYNPMRTNVTNNTYSMGSWGEWEWIKKNRPFVITKQKEIKYSLMNYDYTLTTEGSRLSASNTYQSTSFNGDFVAWIPKIYMKEIYAEDGNSRDVLFALTQEGETWNYIPVGFHNKNGEELEGLWIPMFYPCAMDQRSIYQKDLYSSGGSISSWMSALIPGYWGADNCAALGGPILNVLRDILYMLYRSTDIQKHNGNGFSARTSALTSNLGETVNNKFGGTSTYGFWGQTSASSETGVPSRLFHSVVLGAMYKELVDPYFYIKGGFLWGCKNYKGDPSVSEEEHYESSSAIYYGTNASPGVTHWPNKLAYFGDGFGSVPVGGNSGSTTTGLTDALILKNYNGTSPHYSRRIGRWTDNGNAGIAYQKYEMIKATNVVATYATMSHIIFPDVGFDPTK